MKKAKPMKDCSRSNQKTLRRKFTIVLFVLVIVLPGSDTFAYMLSGTKWAQTQLGAPVTLTYSYSNFFDGGLLDSQDQRVPINLLRTSIEEALSLWAAVAPLHFVEVPDRGPAPSDTSYFGTGFPHIRIGHHPLDGFGTFK